MPETRSSQPAPPTPPDADLAIVLSGGGARAAYQVGLLRRLARELPDLRFPIVTGVSAGAINAAFFAAHPAPLGKSAEALTQIWRRLTVEDIFRVDLPSLARHLVRWATQLVSGGGSPAAADVRGLVDSQPLRATLERSAASVDGEIIGIGRNLERGRLRAVAITALNYSTGQTVTWIQGEGKTWSEGARRSVHARLSIEHVMASAALPLFFPAVRLGESWYGDGGIRHLAPLAPAVRLGARRILAISPHYLQTPAEAERPKVGGYPPPAQILSQLLNAVFLDMLEQDAGRLEDMNRLIGKLPPEEREGWRPVDIVMMRPSENLGELVSAYEPRLPKAFRYLTRSLGTRETTSPDFLSYLMFQPDYLERLMAIGERDCEARMPEILDLVRGGRGEERTVGERENEAAVAR
jgi:NTE family protein